MVGVSNYQYNLGVKGQGQIQTKSVIRLITWIPLSYLRPRVFIYGTMVVYGEVDYNISFLLPLYPWCQKTRSNTVTIIWLLVMRIPSSCFDQGCSYLAQLLLMVCKLQIMSNSGMFLTEVLHILLENCQNDIWAIIFKIIWSWLYGL